MNAIGSAAKVSSIMNETVETVVKLKAEIKAIEKVKKEYEEKIKQFMTMAGIKTLDVDKYRVIFQEITTNSLDTEKLKVDFPDIYEVYGKSSTSNRLNINVIS